MQSIHLGFIDYLILSVYFLFVLGIGWALKRYMKTSSDFFLSGRAIPAWITGLAFISANLGAQEVIGMAASGAKYGIMTSHFYWVGAIPAMVFIGIFMMPLLGRIFGRFASLSGRPPCSVSSPSPSNAVTTPANSTSSRRA